jgi:hypothetical protein
MANTTSSLAAQYAALQSESSTFAKDVSNYPRGQALAAVPIFQEGIALANAEQAYDNAWTAQNGPLPSGYSASGFPSIVGGIEGYITYIQVHLNANPNYFDDFSEGLGIYLSDLTHLSDSTVTPDVPPPPGNTPIGNLSISADQPTITPGDPAHPNATFTVSLNQPLTYPVTVHYATKDGTTSDGIDYTAVSGDLSFAAGQTSQSVSIPILNVFPGSLSYNETFYVDLSAPSASGGPAPSISVNEAKETIKPPGNAGFDVSHYPGDDVMQWLAGNTNLTWVGYYLKASSHRGTSWIGTHDTLVAQGWDVVPIYVGQQAPNWTGALGKHQPSIPAAQKDAKQAITELTKMDPFPSGTTVYLDLESSPLNSKKEQQYVSTWCRDIKDAGFTPGVYCPPGDAQAVHKLVPNAELWITKPAEDPLHPIVNPPIGFAAPDPTLSGVSNATTWQYGIDNHGGFDISTLPGIQASTGLRHSLVVDLDSSTTLAIKTA